MSQPTLHVISASAGSGKTYRLVSEYLVLALGSRGKVDAPFGYRNILAITFTNKAAGEMKERVFGFLKLLSEKNKSVEHLSGELATRCNLKEDELAIRCKNMLHHMWHNYHDLSIRTIDSFMHTVVRGFARDLDLDPEFEVVVDTRVEIAACLDGFLADAGRSKRLTRMLSEVSFRQIQGEKRWDVQSVLEDFVQQHLLRDLTREGLGAYAHQTPEALLALRKASDKEVEDIATVIQQKARAILELFQAAGIENSDVSRGFPAPLKKLAAFRAGDKVDELLKPDGVLQKRMRGETSWMKKKAEKQQAFDAIETQLDGLMHALLEGSRKEVEAYLILQGAAQQWLNLEFLSHFQKVWLAHLETRNMLPVGDFQKKIADVLQNDPSAFVYERIGQRYRHVMIDEFQDTSATQWGNFLPLMLQGLSEGGSGLLVGDGKQSIYRWRGAEAGQFERLAHPDSPPGLMAEERSLKPFIAPDSLGSNWRSAPEVVDFNNGLYARLGVSEYGSEQVYGSPPQKTEKTFSGHVKAQALADKEQVNNEQRLDYVEQYIHDLSRDNYPLERCAILVRTGAQARQIGGHLFEKEIPFTTRESLLVAAWPPAVLLLDAMRWLHTPSDQAVAVRVLLAVENKKGEASGEAIAKALRPDGKRLDVEAAAKAFFSETERGGLPTLPALDQLEALHQRLNGGAADPFVEAVLEGARNLGERGKPSAADMLGWWDDVKQHLSAATEAKPGAIQILTVHKSKGLEFEAVILPLWRRANPSKPLLWLEAPASLETDLPVLVPFSEALAGINPLVEEEAEKKKLDDLNVLYVATTRAVRRLYMLVEVNLGPKATQGISETIWASISEMPGALSDTLWEAGMPQAYPEKEKTQKNVNEKDPAMPEQSVRPLAWPFSLDNQPQLAFMHPRHWDPTQASRIHGQNLHALLARVGTAADCKGAVEQQISEGLAAPEEREELTAVVDALIQHPEASLWFSPGAKVFCERDFLVHSNTQPLVLRPDRVVVTDNEVRVVDYKSGQPKRADKQQVEQYAHMLQSLYPDHKISGYLLYTVGPDVVKVC